MNDNLPNNAKVKLSERNGKSRIAVSPLEAQTEPVHILQLKAEIGERWGATSLLDMLKEIDLRVGFTHLFKSTVTHEKLDRNTLQKSACIYSHVKSCSSSEVAAMIEGVRRHCTEMMVEKNYVDSHGQSEIAFAFCHLLGFDLVPHLQGIHRQKPARPESGQPDAYPNLQPILSRAINWELIRKRYDEIIKYTTALCLGTSDAEAILSRFPRKGPHHPPYEALLELGRVQKTIFLCRYFQSEALRQETHEWLNVVENWNSANGFIFYGKGGDIATNRRHDQELAVLSLHLL